MKFYKYALLVISIALLGSKLSIENVFANPETQDSTTVVTISGGRDFATLVLGNPWDMKQFSDISKALNNSGRENLIQNFQVSNGIFTADSTSTNYALFYPLFPGYVFGMDIGKVGANYPIESNEFQCLYLRMRVDTSFGDSWYVGWLPSQSEIIGPANGGQLWGNQLHDSSLPDGSWRIYEIDLADPPGDPGYFYESWTSRSQWQGLRIHPTNTPNAHFQVDWVRLTDCVPVNYQVTWIPQAGQSRLWAGIDGQQKDILITTLNASQANYTWDVQGLEPGQYEIGVEANGQMTWLSTSLFIEPAPIANFTKPSPYSGEDFATSMGDPWDFSESNDLVDIRCFDWFLSNGIFDLTTLAPANLPSYCTGSIGEADTQFRLNLHGANPTGAEYRYLSFRHNIDGDLERSADGMIGRWIWRYGTCTQVSEEIPYDVGWHTYTVDLYDPSLSFAEEAVGCSRNYWINSGPIERLRFDPNENWTGNLVPAMTFHQQFDWIRLTKVDQAVRGTPFPIQISLNKSPDSVQQIDYYYTDDLNYPTRYPANSNVQLNLDNKSDVETILAGNYNIYLPLVGKNSPEQSGPPAVDNEILFWWDTSGVTPAEYYTCAVINDGYNQTTFCSEAPVKVVP